MSLKERFFPYVLMKQAEVFSYVDSWIDKIDFFVDW